MALNLRVSSRSALVCALSGLGLVLASCQYDLDKPFEHTPPDAGLPSDLIELWKTSASAVLPPLSDACTACAREKCAVESADCLGDQECLALTRCVAKAQNPAEQLDCRAEHLPWLSESIQERDTGGPYQQCVFVTKCTAECDARAQLACKGTFSWATTLAPTVKARLRFVPALASGSTAGIRVRICQSENPLECRTTSPTATSDANGEVDLDLPVTLGAFQGYLELEGGGQYPSMLKFGWPVARDMATVITVVDDFSARALGGAATVKVDNIAFGQIQARMFGCTGVPTRGVTVSLEGGDATNKTWYTSGFEQPFPDFTLTETGVRGASGIVNVPPGNARVIATRNGERIASVRAPVRAGYMTIVIVNPGDSSI